MNQFMPFAAQFVEEPQIEAIQLPAYDPESQMSASESYGPPCVTFDTYCQRWQCWGDQPEDCGNVDYPCDTDTMCAW